MVEENNNNLKQNFMEKFKLAQHDYEEGIAQEEKNSGSYKQNPVISIKTTRKILIWSV
jgi:hypothetical protein